MSEGQIKPRCVWYGRLWWNYKGDFCCGAGRLQLDTSIFFCFLDGCWVPYIQQEQKMMWKVSIIFRQDQTPEQAKSLGGRRCLVWVPPPSVTDLCEVLAGAAGAALGQAGGEDIRSTPNLAGKHQIVSWLDCGRGRQTETYCSGVERGRNVTIWPAGKGRPLVSGSRKFFKWFHTH